MSGGVRIVLGLLISLSFLASCAAAGIPVFRLWQRRRKGSVHYQISTLVWSMLCVLVAIW